MRVMHRFLRLILSFTVATGFAGSAAAAPLKVASLSTVLSDLARNIGADKVRVEEIVRAGVDPHEFQPTPGDIEKVSSADVVLASGKGIEGYLAKLEDAVGDKKKFVDVGNKIGASLKLKDEGKVIDDPHWWHSVANVRRAVDVVRDAFIAANPADKEAFTAAAAAYQARLDGLDKSIKLKVAELGRDKRKLVTSHDAFQYFARDYGFKIYPIEGISTAEEPSTRHVAGLLETINTEKVKAVFFENMQSPKVIAQITKETGAKVGGELYADGLGVAGSDATSYLDMMHHNASTIVDALK